MIFHHGLYAQLRCKAGDLKAGIRQYRKTVVKSPGSPEAVRISHGGVVPHLGGSQNGGDFHLVLNAGDLRGEIAAAEKIRAHGEVGHGHVQTLAFLPQTLGVILPAGSVVGPDVYEFDGVKTHFFGLGNAGELVQCSFLHPPVHAVGAQCDPHMVLPPFLQNDFVAGPG